MDVSNSFGSEAAQGRSVRMRSWYLMEQYKALERCQRDAAAQLQSRSYQEGLLTRELSERRQRRLTNPSLSSSEIHLQATFSDTSRSAADDLYEHLCECHDEELCQAMDSDASLDSDGSVDDSKVDKPLEYDESGDDMKEEDRGSNEDATSVVENVRSLRDMADDIKDQLETVKKDIAQNIQLQLAAFRHSPPPPSEFEDAVATMRSHCRGPAAGVPRVSSASNTSVLALWSRLVSFAYQVTQLNHGNVLQPYVSPIKFPTDDEDSDHNIMSANKKQLTCKWRRKPNKKLSQRSRSKQRLRFENAKRVSYTDESGQYAFLNEHSNHVISEPCGNVSSQCGRWSLSTHLGPERSGRMLPESYQTYCDYSEGLYRPASTTVVNPMLKVVQYVDKMLDLDDSKRIF